MKAYKCNKCGLVVLRPKRKGKYPAWMLSFCTQIGKVTRLYPQKKGGDA